ncbi:MAG: polysaccharide deacetylase family protein [Candidatus Diapherotrites archaeon]
MPNGGDFSICTWSGGKATATTIFFDDCWRDSVNAALPILEKHGIKANFAVIAGLLGKRFEGTQCISLAEMESLRNAGHEISSHGMTHRRLVDLGQGEVLRELSESGHMLGAETIAYPYARHNYRIRNAARRHYLAGRVRGDKPNSSTPHDLLCLGAFSSTCSTAREMDGWLEKSAGGWLIEIHHLIGIKKGYSYCTMPSQLDRHLASLRSGDVWIDTMANVAKYILERENSKIEAVSESARTLTVRAVSRLDAQRFNVPLSFEYGGRVYCIKPGCTLEIPKGARQE